MLDPIINFFSRMFFLIGRGIGLVIAWILWPFLKVAAWYRSTGVSVAGDCRADPAGDCRGLWLVRL